MTLSLSFLICLRFYFIKTYSDTQLVSTSRHIYRIQLAKSSKITNTTKQTTAIPSFNFQLRIQKEEIQDIITTTGRIAPEMLKSIHFFPQASHEPHYFYSKKLSMPSSCSFRYSSICFFILLTLYDWTFTGFSTIIPAQYPASFLQPAASYNFTK